MAALDHFHFAAFVSQSLVVYTYSFNCVWTDPYKDVIGPVKIFSNKFILNLMLSSSFKLDRRPAHQTCHFFNFPLLMNLK